MRFIKKWSYCCAKSITRATNENHQKRAIYYYAFYIIFGAIVKAIFMFVAACLLGVFLPTLCVVFAFGSLRMFAGGYHMNTYSKCLYISMALFLAAALLSKYTAFWWNLTSLGALLSVTIAAGIYILGRYAPKDIPNKPLTDPEKKSKLKKQSMIYFFIMITAIVFLIIHDLKTYAVAACLAILLELFTLTPSGHRFFDSLVEKIDGAKRKVKQNVVS